MSKLKVHSGASKRFKSTGAGLKRKKANKSHILTKMKTKRKRQLRGTTEISKGDQQLVDKMLKIKT
jgi:large subunit ribosomal protein L35